MATCSESITIEQVLLEEIRELDGSTPELEARLKNLASVEWEALTSDHAKDLRKAEQEYFAEIVDKRGHESPRIALCLSGGGIRSATFCLGVLQELSTWIGSGSRHGKSFLEAIDYLSTVSGGGYIGSWLTRWIHEDGISAVVNERGGLPDPNAEPIGNLRGFASYLAPARGLSLDSVTLLAIYSRNLLLNWLVLIPLIGCLVALPRLQVIAIGIYLTQAKKTGDNLSQLAARGSDSPWLLILAVAIGIGLLAFSLRRVQSASNSDQLRSLTGWFGFPILYSAILTTIWAVRPPSGESYGLALGGFGLLVSAIGWVAFEYWQRQNATAGSQPKAGDRPAYPAVAGILLSVAALAPPVGIDNSDPLWLTIWGTTCCCGLYCTFLAGYAGLTGRWSSRAHRETLGRMTASIAKPAVGWLLLSWVSLRGPEWVLHLGASLAISLAASGLLAGALAGVVGYRTDGAPGSEAPARPSGVRKYALPGAAGAFAVVIALIVSLATSAIIDPESFRGQWENAGRYPDAATLCQQFRERSRVERYKSEFQTAPLDLTCQTSESSPAGILVPLPFPRPLTDEFTSAVSQQLQTIDRSFTPLSIGPLSGWSTLLNSLGKAHSGTVTWTGNENDIDRAARTAVFFLSCVAMVLSVSFLIGSNRFSLHELYGNRLVRAYLGAARADDKRSPNHWTGFDETDDISIHERPKVTGRRALHLLNAALNITRSSARDPQKRRAAPFTFSRLHIGSRLTRFRRGGEYGTAPFYLSLGRAMTISGAAVSPVMGYHSSGAVAFLLTFFNVTLGWWLPNPKTGRPGDFRRMEPALGLFRDLEELTGQTSEESKWVYLSDGGHFDNLGLYEMVRRRCRLIIAVDAGCDPDYRYEDLARVLRMIRTDFGVEAEVQPNSGPAMLKPPKHAYTLIRLTYPGSTEHGMVVYLKPVLLDGLPPDVLEYAEARLREAKAVFPHESTGDQFFDEAQFESYRELGRFSFRQVKDVYESWTKILDGALPPLPEETMEAGGEGSDLRSIPTASANGRDGTGGLLARLSAGTAAWLIGGAMLTTAAVTTVAVKVSGTLGVERLGGNLTVSSVGGSVDMKLPTAELGTLFDKLTKAITEESSIAMPLADLARQIDELRRVLGRIRRQPPGGSPLHPPGDPATESTAREIRDQLVGLREQVRTIPIYGSEGRKSIDTIQKELTTLRTKVEQIAPRRNIKGAE